MNIFISWSGDLSKQIGEIFKDWMPTVIQSIKPYFTPSDIEKGSRWENEISKKLSECSTGIIILTKENLKSQWMMFEAGALSNKLDKSRVCPILIEVDNTELTGPLSTFQTTKFSKEDIKQLMLNVNKQCGDNKLTDKVFEEVFKVFWPHLEEKVNNVIEKNIQNKDIVSTERSDRELLEEVLELSRMMSRTNSSNSRDKNFKKYLRNKNEEERVEMLKPFISEYLKSTNTRFKEFQLTDPVEVCEAIEQNEEVRAIGINRNYLLKVVSDYLHQ